MPTGRRRRNSTKPGFHTNRSGEQVKNTGRQDKPQDERVTPGEMGHGRDGGGPSFDQWFQNKQAASANPSQNWDVTKQLAQTGWDEGLRGRDMRGLFSQGAENLFASNYAGGQGQPSPYNDYFMQNPGQVGALNDWFQSGGNQYGAPSTAGPGMQQSLFDAMPGLRDSYLASLGLQNTANGQVGPMTGGAPSSTGGTPGWTGTPTPSSPPLMSPPNPGVNGAPSPGGGRRVPTPNWSAPSSGWGGGDPDGRMPGTGMRATQQIPGRRIFNRNRSTY